ncbi:MAG: GNAT family N-acetyltransferase [Micromonosporaceae bacterium]
MSAIRIEPWAEDDLELLHRSNSPQMTAQLGGPETDEKVMARHQRYLAMTDDTTGRMFRIVLETPDAGVEKVGGNGYWEKEWRDQTVYETGWHVLPPYQGRGIAAAATRELVALLRRVGRHRYLHAFPKVTNLPSNAICRKVGFTLLEECDFEYPAGNPIRCNDWRLDLAVLEERD